MGFLLGYQCQPAPTLPSLSWECWWGRGKNQLTTARTPWPALLSPLISLGLVPASGLLLGLCGR